MSILNRKAPRLRGIVVWSLLALTRLAAQDVLVGAARPFAGDEALDEMPQPKNRLKPAYPAEMKKTGEAGYAILTIFVDAGGKQRSINALGAPHPFQRAVEEALRDWKLRPATHAGQPVDAWCWIPVIFNPATAAAGRPEATPRLTRVSPVLVPADPRDHGPGIWAIDTKIAVSAAGAVENITLPDSTPARLKPLIEAAVREWGFEPARHEGRAVAADITLTVTPQVRALPVATKAVPPRFLKQTRPHYPRAMEASGMKGEVTVEMVIDREGNVQQAMVLTSNNPGFDEEALATVRKWKFKPAEVNGRPVSTKVKQAIVFEFAGGGGNEAFAIESRSSKANPPYDEAPKLRGVVEPVYPYALFRNRMKGTVEVLFAIASNGRVTEVKVVSATHPDLGGAMAAAVETFVFDPALKQGRPVASVLRMKKEFDYSEERDRGLWDREQDKPGSVVSAKALDQPLRPISQPSPQFPLDPQAGDGGEAVIELLVDEDGRACLPRVAGASAPAFGYAAAQAVSAWRFEPPKVKGRPVVVRVRIPIDFRRAPPG